MSKNFKLTFVAFFLAWLLTYILASIFHTQQVLDGLVEIGITIPFENRINTFLFDIWGLLPKYGSGVALALAIAFSVGAMLQKKLPYPYILFPLAGFSTMLAIHLLLYPIMHITLIAGARSSTGLAMQGLAGFCGGIAFWLLRYRGSVSDKHYR